MARYVRRRSIGRKGRRSRRTLSTRNIFSNKGSKAQARQISALKHRINRVYQRTRPEFKVLRSTVDNRGFGYDSTSSAAPSLVNYYMDKIALPELGTADNQRIGNKITIYPVNFFLNVRYMEVNQVLNNLSPYITSQLANEGMMLRFIAIQQIAPSFESPYLDEIINGVQTGGGTMPQQMMMNMTAPFKNGITARYKILKDKRIKVTKDSGVYAARLKIRPQIKTVRWEDNANYPAGLIWIIILTAGGEMLMKQADPGSEQYWHYNELDTTWRYEITYTDA